MWFIEPEIKFLQLVNQPEEGVYNGDMGEIVTIFFAKENTEHG